jgi:hypothetical protein
MRRFLLVPVLLLACSKPTTTEPPTSDGGELPAADGGETPAADGGETPAADGGETPSGERPEMTAAECEAQKGKVVGDIGDGAIHKPDYVCPESGKPPIGTIKPEPGGAVAVEGSVCCV